VSGGACFVSRTIRARVLDFTPHRLHLLDGGNLSHLPRGRDQLLRLFLKRRTFDDHKREEFVAAISAMLQVQLTAVGNHRVEDDLGNINPKALGYIYGFIDAALRTIGQDMANESIGIPITFHILRLVFPGSEEKYLEFLTECVGHDPNVTIAAMTGGQQYIDFNNGKLAVPMGLARYILNRD